jgi:26S proteasome regulatory subunit T5
MEVDERPKDDFNSVGGLDQQMTELIEAVVLPMKEKERFDAIGIKPPKGVFFALHCSGIVAGGVTYEAQACSCTARPVPARR